MNDYEYRNLDDRPKGIGLYCIGLLTIATLILFLLFVVGVKTAIGAPPDTYQQATSPLQEMLTYDAASVTISGSGCSGTLICPRTVLTAAHCQTTGQRVTVRLSSGSTVTGKVIAHREKDGVDAAIIRLDSSVNNLPHVPVASNYPPDGSEVLVYGRAKSIGNIRITRYRSNVQRNINRWSNMLHLVGTTSAIGGESGGGGFYGGKVIGVVARSDDKTAGRGSLTGLSNTPGTYQLVAANTCKTKDCET